LFPGAYENALLRIRCEVLEYPGYNAKSATVEDAANLINEEAFDLIILSAFSSEMDQQRVLSAAGDTPALVLQGVAIAPAFLAAVEAKLASANPAQAEDRSCCKAVQLILVAHRERVLRRSSRLEE
jgi:CheY-like chemotaxis protein